MGFIDMDEFTQAAKDSTIVPHPLAEKLAADAKASYLGMIVFAALVDDGNLDASERKAMRETGLALQLPESEIDDTVNTVTGLKTDQEKIAFVKDSLPVLGEHDTAMFLYCNMVGVMIADGELTDDAKAFLSGMAKFLKISPEDLNFLNEYADFLTEGKKPEAAEVVFKYAAQKLPEGLVSYFTPVLNPVHIPGGQLPLGDNEFCNGRFIIDSQVIVGAGSTLSVRNAEIEFGIDGWIEIGDADAEFFDSKLTAVEGNAEIEEVREQVFLIKSSAAKLLFSGCSFDGKMTSAAICQEHRLTMVDCRFNRLKYTDGNCVTGGDMSCDRCSFDNCSGNIILNSNSDIRIRKTEFILCTASYIAKGYNLDQAVVLYKKCKSSNYLWYNNSASVYKTMCYSDCAGRPVHSDATVDYETWKKAFEEEESEGEK